MCKPLKDIVAELEAKYKGEELKYDLEERSRVIAEFDRDLEYTISFIERYVEDVKYVLERNLDKNIITRSTLNLLFVMQHLYKSTANCDYAFSMYLLDERYEKNHDLSSRYTDASQKLVKRFDDLLQNNVFNVEQPKGEVIEKVFYNDSVTKKRHLISPSYFHKEVAEKLNGAEMIMCVRYLLLIFEVSYSSFKFNVLYQPEDELIRVYELNYLFYAKNYWPEREQNFRSHIKRYYKINISELEKLRREKIIDFESTSAGKIWRDYSESQDKMASQMQYQKINDEQWKYFFQNIFEIEDYTRWIEELQKEAGYERATPPEAPHDKTSRDARVAIANELFELAENGPWVNGITAEDIKKMLKNVLGLGETALSDKQEKMSMELWKMLEHGRGGDRVRITWQKIVGYLWNKKLLDAKSAPELNKEFFRDKTGSDNINKGRYGALEEIVPLLDALLPKIRKKG